MTLSERPATPEHTEADLKAIRTVFDRTAPHRMPQCLYTFHTMRGALKGLFPESPVFIFSCNLPDGHGVFLTVRIVKTIAPELSFDTSSMAKNFNEFQDILDEMFDKAHKRFPQLLSGEQRFMFVGQKPLQDCYMNYINTKQNGIYKPQIYPTYLYYMNQEQQEKVLQLDLPLPEGYYFDETNPEVDHKIITKTWIHAKEGDYEQTRSKLTNLPSVLIRHEKDGTVAFEMCHPCEYQNHLFVLPEHRRRGLGNAVEMRLSQLCVKNGIIPYKTVEFLNKPVVDGSDRHSLWTRWNYEDGSPVCLEYRQFYPLDKFPSS
ncbi:hypothetical protein L596_015208 [Steinernema carpocapsae]|uniref:Glycine N-acyltransferase-like protein n=2 Tax=Steinernema carpocapsae TaxID=34508 RepID=A0A4U5NF65_STECR|nr:hypothetical protein L596_015208 [Steinernema carpocapsae]